MKWFGRWLSWYGKGKPMKAWHVTCTCAIRLLCVSYSWYRISWVAQDLSVPRPFVLWGWPRVTNYLQRSHVPVNAFPDTFLERGFCHHILIVRLTTLPSNMWMNLSASNQVRFFPQGSRSAHWKKGHRRLKHLKNNLPGFFSVWDMVRARGLQQWHVILSRGRW